MPSNNDQLDQKLLHKWTITLSPSLDEINYFLSSKFLSIAINDISLHHRYLNNQNNQALTMNFNYDISSGSTSTSGVFSMIIEDQKTYNLSQLYSDHQQNKKNVSNILKGLPIIGLLFSAFSVKSKKNHISIRLVLKKSPP